MKYAIGIIIGIALSISGYALAATAGTSGLAIVDHLDFNYDINGTVEKLYDRDADVVCYIVDNGSSAAISCVK